MTHRAKKLASLTAAGVGAVTLTSGAAQASIVKIDVNQTLSFTGSPATPNSSNLHVNLSHRFNGTSLAPQFSVVLYSLMRGGNTFNRFANLYFGPKSTHFLNPQNARIAAGKTWNQVLTTSATYARLADRSWGNVSTLKGKPAGTNFYELFRFSNNSGLTFNYGWVQYDVIVTQANSNSIADGPNIKIDRYAWQTTPGVTIGAGVASSTPEPGTLSETALAALILGADGLRRWRKSRSNPRPALG